MSLATRGLPGPTRTARWRAFEGFAAICSTLPSPPTTGALSSAPATGSIIEFRSVVDAVRCVIEGENGLFERNAGVPPERRIESFASASTLATSSRRATANSSATVSTSPCGWKA